MVSVLQYFMVRCNSKIIFILITLQLGIQFLANSRQPEIQTKANIKFKHFTLEDGLNQSTVLAILQDREGFMWFGTRDGLNKFDGQHFTVFQYNLNDTTSISHNWIKVLFEDADGNIWVGTENGLNRFRKESNDFERYLHEEGGMGANTFHAIRDIAQTPDKDLYIGTENGLGKLSVKSGILTPLEGLDKLGQSRNANRVRKLLIDSRDGLWVITMAGVYYQTNGSGLPKKYDLPSDMPTDMDTNALFALYEDNFGNIWMGYENGLAILDPAQGYFAPYQMGGNRIVNTSVREILEDEQGMLWAGAYDGLYRIDVIRQEVGKFVHQKDQPNSISQNSIHSISNDSAGNLWIGTWAGGVNYLDKSYGVFTSYTSGQYSAMLSPGVVSSFAEDPQGNMWVGTEGGGLNYFDRQTGEFTHYVHDPDNNNSLSANNIKALLLDHKNSLWIGTHDGGLNRMDQKDGDYEFTRYYYEEGNASSLSGDWVIALHEDSTKTIWVGTSGGGLNWYDRERDSFQKPDSANSHIGPKVFVIREGHQNQVYVGSDNGLVQFDRGTKKLRAFKNEEVLLPGKTVLSVYTGDKQYLWIGTEGYGLYAYHREGGELTRYGQDDGLPNEVVYGILAEADPNLWLSTNKGLCKFNTNTGQVKNYDVYDGLQSNEFNYGAYFQTSEKELVFGGAKGFNIFYPANIRDNPFVPPVVITGFRIKNQTEHLQQFLVGEIKGKEYLELKHEQNIISFDFVALNYSQPEKNQYAYMLEGFDEDWNYIGNNRTATYTNLNHGSYTFRVKGSNNDQVWNEKGVAIDVVILPPYWQTWWAYSLYVIAFVLSMLLARKYTMMRIQDKNALKLERIEKENVERVNQMKMQFFTNISHEFRTPLTLIIDPLERLIKTGKFDHSVSKKLAIMQSNASVLIRLINQLLDFRKHEFGKLVLRASEGDVASFVKEVCQSFKEQARQHKIDFKVNKPPFPVNCWFDKGKLEEILYNLLSNAFKHTPDKGYIHITIRGLADWSNSECDKGAVEIVVQDNGKGMSPKSAKYIFDRFYQLEHSGGDKNTGTGIGLSLTKNLVELHQGEITVSSEVGKGTCFFVRLPLGSAHLNDEQMVQAFEDFQEESHPEESAVESKPPGYDETDPKVELLKLLIVEDNRDVREYVRSIFDDRYEVSEAEDGMEGVTKALDLLPDLIISDVMMPRLNGIELCRQLKGNMATSHIPIILLTAKASEAHQQEGLQTGADDYIAKPFNSELLELKVNNIVRSRQKLQHKLRQSLILEPGDFTFNSPDEAFLKQAIGIIEKHLANSDFNVHVFIEEMGMSRSVVYRKIKALTDQSTIDFIKETRLKKAAQILADPSRNISEVAYGTGFNDVKYFRNCFKEQFGMSPSSYRKEYYADS